VSGGIVVLVEVGVGVREGVAVSVSVGGGWVGAVVKVGGGVKLAVRVGGTKPVEVMVGVRVSDGIIVMVAEGMSSGVSVGDCWLGVGVPVAEGARRIATIPAQ
jgi:hypothetical protein